VRLERAARWALLMLRFAAWVCFRVAMRIASSHSSLFVSFPGL
jgi:hypothetical protein